MSLPSFQLVNRGYGLMEHAYVSKVHKYISDDQQQNIICSRAGGKASRYTNLAPCAEQVSTLIGT